MSHPGRQKTILSNTENGQKMYGKLNGIKTLNTGTQALNKVMMPTKSNRKFVLSNGRGKRQKKVIAVPSAWIRQSLFW